MIKNSPIKNIPNFLIITGLSGSGMSSATNAFEDLGYFCVDNLPVTMISTFARLLLPDEEEKVAIEKAALVINIRERHFLGELGNKSLQPFVVFFEASDEVLQRRFSETRRPHPAYKGKGLLLESIQDERRAMHEVRENADLIIDTSEHSVHTLRRLIVEKFSSTEEGTPLQVQIISFGHKYGTPIAVDLLFDVRHLPNPYFVPELKNFVGTDEPIIDFLEKEDDVNETNTRFIDLLEYLLPLYKREGKSYLTIGIGCTGGKHRSVYTAERIGRVLKEKKYEVSMLHRDILKGK
jgi:RNase adapter protein RapZ